MFLQSWEDRFGFQKFLKSSFFTLQCFVSSLHKSENKIKKYSDINFNERRVMNSSLATFFFQGKKDFFYGMKYLNQIRTFNNFWKCLITLLISSCIVIVLNFTKNQKTLKFEINCKLYCEEMKGKSKQNILHTKK